MGYRSHGFVKQEWAKALVTNTRGNTTRKKCGREEMEGPGKERWQIRVNNITGIKDSCLTIAYFVSILDRGKDPFFTNTFHDSRGVPIPGPRGPPGPVGEGLTCFMDVCTVYWICICINNLRLSVFLDMCSKTDDKQFQTSTRWSLLVLIWILIFYIRVLQAPKVQQDLQVHPDKLWANTFHLLK